MSISFRLVLIVLAVAGAGSVAAQESPVRDGNGVPDPSNSYVADPSESYAVETPQDQYAGTPSRDLEAAAPQCASNEEDNGIGADQQSCEHFGGTQPTPNPPRVANNFDFDSRQARPPLLAQSGSSYCREYQQTVVTSGQSRIAYGRACWGPDGFWRIVTPPSVSRTAPIETDDRSYAAESFYPRYGRSNVSPQTETPPAAVRRYAAPSYAPNDRSYESPLNEAPQAGWLARPGKRKGYDRYDY